MHSIQQATREAACGHEQSTDSTSSPRTSASSASSTEANYSNGSTRLPTPPPHSGVVGSCVTASVGNIHLDRPISVGELVEVHASLVYTGRSSMHILVTVCSSDLTGPSPFKPRSVSIVFVAVDDSGHPVEVPRWTPVTMLELQRQRQARVRMRTRKRIDAAMAAESYTAEGTASSAALRFVATRQDRRRRRPAVDRRSGRRMRSRLGWRPSPHVLHRRDPLLPPGRHRRRHRRHRTNHPHGTAQHPHQRPASPQSQAHPCRTRTRSSSHSTSAAGPNLSRSGSPAPTKTIDSISTPGT